MSLPLYLAMQAMSVARPSEEPSSYDLAWVDTGGTGTIYYNGDMSFMTDNTNINMFFALRGLNRQNNTTRRLYGNNGARVIYTLNSTNKLNCSLQDASGADLVTWTSTANMNVAGTFMFHIAADLSGTPSFHVYKSELVSGVWGAWTDEPGSFADGPTAGTVDISRGFANPDIMILGYYSGGFLNQLDCDFGLFHLTVSGSPVNHDLLIHDGILEDPSTFGSPLIRLMGPEANLTDDTGSANLTFTLDGSDWADV